MRSIIALPSFLSSRVVTWHTHSLRNYITKDWFRDIAFRQEPSPLAKRIAEVLGVSAGENEGNTGN